MFFLLYENENEKGLIPKVVGLNFNSFSLSSVDKYGIELKSSVSGNTKFSKNNKIMIKRWGRKNEGKY